MPSGTLSVAGFRILHKQMTKAMKYRQSLPSEIATENEIHKIKLKVCGSTELVQKISNPHH